jgi:hypothetical protein
LIDGVMWPTSEHYFQAQKFAVDAIRQQHQWVVQLGCLSSPETAAMWEITPPIRWMICRPLSNFPEGDLWTIKPLFYDRM